MRLEFGRQGCAIRPSKAHLHRPRLVIHVHNDIVFSRLNCQYAQSVIGINAGLKMSIFNLLFDASRPECLTVNEYKHGSISCN